MVHQKKLLMVLNHHFKNNKNSFYQIFGNKEKISISYHKMDLSNISYEHYSYYMDVVKGTDSPLEGAKRGKNTSMWLAIQSVKEKKSDVVISAGNTGASIGYMLNLILMMIENIDKPALSALMA